MRLPGAVGWAPAHIEHRYLAHFLVRKPHLLTVFGGKDVGRKWADDRNALANLVGRRTDYRQLGREAGAHEGPLAIGAEGHHAGPGMVATSIIET